MTSPRHKESKSSQSEIYTKTIATFMPYMGEAEAIRLAVRIDDDVRKIREGIGNTLIILRNLGDDLYDIRKNIIYKEVISNIDALRSPLVDFLTQYTKPEEAKVLADQAMVTLKTEFTSTKDFHKIRNSIEEQTREQLKNLPALKKIVEPVSFYFSFTNIFDDFKKRIDSKFEGMNDELLELLEKEMPKDLAAEMEDQFDAVEKVKEEVSELIRKKIEPLKSSYAEYYQSMQQLLFMEAAQKGMSKIESINYAKDEFPKRMATIDKVFEDIMDGVLSEWAKDKSEEMIKIVDFKSIKTMVKFELTLDHTGYVLKQTLDALNASTAPAVLSEAELIAARNDFRRFLQEARKNKLNILCEKKLQDMNVSNLHLEDAKDDFRSLFFSLPKESQVIFAEEKCTAEQVDALNLSSWNPTKKELTLLSSQTLLPQATEYARLYEGHCQQLAEEKRQSEALTEEAHLLELGRGRADPAKTKALIESIQKSIDSRFNFFVTRSSLETLIHVNDAVTLPGFKTKDESLSNEMIKVLQARIGELRRIVYSAPSSSCVSPSSPILARGVSEVSVEKRVDKTHSFNR